jgi:NADPH:quinone reductase-like Zn-dependent oxidoreductase
VPDVPSTTRQLRSLVDESGEVRLSIETVDTPRPRAHQVLVRVEAAPLNPSDLGLLLAMADVDSAAVAGSGDDAVVTAPISPKVMPALAARVGTSMPVGNEGAGVVVAAGDSPEAQALLGRRVAFLGEGTYAEHAVAVAQMCLPLPDGATAADGASSFVNPLTALGMVETMRREGHTALVHTAAASNLGQMLNRICRADGVPLVNIVRKPEQAALLRDQGAVHVCDSSSDTFFPDLVAALKATGATLAFDAVGGGDLASQILNAMEVAATEPDAPYSRYGTNVWKQVYVYGALDRRPIELRRGFGFAWGVGGWLLTPFLGKLAPEDLGRLMHRVADELTTTFASHYSDELSLVQVLDLDVLRRYARQATGEKFLVTPQA